MYKFIGKKNQTYDIKLNYNCPDSEKSGVGPGSCGGGSNNSEKQTKDKAFIPKNKTIEKNKEIVNSVKNIKIDNISSNYQSKQEDKEYIDETKKDITNSLSISKYNYTPDEMMEVIKSIDDNIAQLEMIISANIKYYNDKLDTNDKSVGMKIFHDKVTLAAMKEVNMTNKEYYDKKIK